MQEVALTLEQKYKVRLKKDPAKLQNDLKAHGIKQYTVAKLAGISPQAVTNQFSNKNLTYGVYVAANMLIEEAKKNQK